MAALTAVFLDRDGTINRSPAPGDYISDPADLRLLDGAADAITLLHACSHACVVVSNQRGIALGRMNGQQLSAVDARLHELVDLDGSYYCVHGLDDDCPCRKPRAGLLLRAAADLGLDLAHSWMIGDSDSDIEAGRRAGCHTIKVAARDGALLAAARRIAAIPNTTTPLAGGAR
jgi:D-glycero-D-manno-heptose 1,7-bisphosphate phosphatase